MVRSTQRPTHTDTSAPSTPPTRMPPTETGRRTRAISTLTRGIPPATCPPRTAPRIKPARRMTHLIPHSHLQAFYSLYYNRFDSPECTGRAVFLDIDLRRHI